MSYPYQAPGFPGAYPFYMNPYQQPQAPQPIQPQASMAAQSPPAAPQPAPAMGQATQAAPAMQNGGFAFVRNEQEARDYPVAPGNYMTFKDEHAPYLYEKSKSFSQLDEPMFEKYRLIKEGSQTSENTEAPLAVENKSTQEAADNYAKLYEEMDRLRGDLEELSAEVDNLRRQIKDGGERKNSRSRKEAEE